MEGLSDLIHADTELQRKQAIKQLDGGLIKQFNQWRNQIIKVMANIEAFIGNFEKQCPLVMVKKWQDFFLLTDFAESEDIEDEIPAQVRGQVHAILESMRFQLEHSKVHSGVCCRFFNDTMHGSIQL